MVYIELQEPLGYLHTPRIVQFQDRRNLWLVLWGRPQAGAHGGIYGLLFPVSLN